MPAPIEQDETGREEEDHADEYEHHATGHKSDRGERGPVKCEHSDGYDRESAAYNRRHAGPALPHRPAPPGKNDQGRVLHQPGLGERAGFVPHCGSSVLHHVI